MSDVKVHFLSEGDGFNFTSKRVMTTKQLITEPMYKDNRDSYDLFSPDEGRELLTRLVDQTALYNIGYSASQEDFPPKSPKF